MKCKSFVFVILSFAVFGNLFAGFNFSGGNAKIKVESGTKFLVNRAINNINGTLDVINLVAASIQGTQNLSFLNGFLGNGFVGMAFSGNYDTAGGDKIILNGNISNPNRISAESGAYIQEIEIRGIYNSIEGGPEFGAPIVFDGDPKTTLTIGIQSSLNKNLRLNGGNLILSDDLCLADNAIIEGPGTVKPEGYSLNLSGDEIKWTSTLLFIDAGDISLNAKTSLSGTWTFSGTNVICGNGCVLDMPTGVIRVTNGSTLQLNGVIIKDLKGNQLVLEGDDSKVVMSNVMIQLTATFTTDIGNIYIDSESTFVTRSHAWWFAIKGSLSVDGVTLWTDRAGAAAPYGLGVKFETPESAHYASVNSGTIKQITAGADFSALQELVNSNSNAIINWSDLSIDNSNAIIHWSDLSIDNSNAIINLQNEIEDTDDDHLMPGHFLSFTFDQTFDVSGRNYVFSHWDQPQFIVDPGVVLTIKNIELLRINENTFSMGEDSVLQIGENVVFELSEDVDWCQGTIKVLGENNTFKIRGMDIRRKFTFKKRCGQCIQTDFSLDLGKNYLRIENIELTGLHLFDGSTKLAERQLPVLGRVVLAEDAVVNIYYPTRMNFGVVGNRNELRLHNNNIRLQGELTYGSLPENVLHIKFLLVDSLAIPRVYFDNMFMFVDTNAGIARLIFDDSYVQVYNELESSFVVGKNSFLCGKTIEILNNSIKQISPYFTMCAGLIIKGDMDSVIVQDATRSFFGGTDLSIKNTEVKLSAAGNEILVDKGVIPDFGISDELQLSLYLTNGSVLHQKSAPVFVKSNDFINVIGTGNKIVVKDKFTINGLLTFGEQSELIFEFDPCVTDPEVIFNSSLHKILTISKGTRLRFVGNGAVTFKDGYTIKFGGTVLGKTSELVLDNTSEFLLDKDASVSVNGVGNIFVTNNGKLKVGSGQRLTIGQASTDIIGLLVDQESAVSVSGALSFQNSLYSINFLRNSMLNLEDGGLLEINSLNRVESRGLLSEFVFQQGAILKIEKGGLLLIGRNKINSLGNEISFNWDNSESTMNLGGMVKFVGNSLSGILQNNLFGPVDLSAENCIKRLINTMPSLAVTTLFVDSSGNRKIQTKSGVIVDLLNGDVVIDDNAITGDVSLVNNGEFIQISSQGERL